MQTATILSETSSTIPLWQKKLKTISDHELERDLARSDYNFYCLYTHRGTYVPARHTRLICSKLRQIETGELNKLMIFMPPRHSKSMTVTETFPSYFVGKDPSRRIIVVSYSDFLAHRFGRRNREKVCEYGAPIFGVNIQRGNASVTDWGLEGHRGGMISAGIGAGITGEGADLLIIDDPIKNRREAHSAVYREMIWNEWQSTLISRLHPGGAIIIILTRWHEDDLAGRLLLQEPAQWEVLNLPCEAEENDLLGREVGEPLWAEHGFDKEWIASRKVEVGSRAWASLYQQRPAAEEGEILKRHWWRFWCYPGQEKNLRPIMVHKENGDLVVIKPEPLPEEKFDTTAQSWDMAFKASDEGSYVVGQVWKRKGSRSFLMDQVRERLDFPATIRAFLALSERWPETEAKWIEDKANGPAVIASLKQEVTGLIPINPEGSKETRVHAVSAQIEAGNVYLPHPDTESWVNAFIEECAVFPNGMNDDQVDAMSQALNRMGSRRFAFV